MISETDFRLLKDRVVSLAGDIDTLRRDLVEKTHGGSYVDKMRQLQVASEVHAERIRELGGRMDILREETPDVLTLGSLRSELQDLRKQLFGDTEMKAAYEKAKKTGTWPAMPGPKLEDPPPGLFESIQAQLESLGRMVGGYQIALDGKTSFVRKLEAFFGPLIAANNSAPLDGEQISTKAFVDEGIGRIARTIRAEIEQKFTERALKLSYAYDVAKALIDVLGEMPKDRDNTANTSAREVARKLYRVWRREEDLQTAEKNQHGRLESLVHAITGRGGRRP